MARRTGRGSGLALTASARADRRIMAAAGQAILNPVPVGRDVAPPRISTWTPLSSFVDLTWGQVQAYKQGATRGMTQPAVDLSRRMLQSDDHMLSCYESRIDAVAGAPYTIKPPAGVGPDQKAIAERAAADCTWALALHNVERFFAHLLDAWYTGYAVVEIVWSVSGGMVVPIELILHHPRRFQFADDFSLYVWDPSATQGQEWSNAPLAFGPPLARDKFVVHIPNVIPDYPTTSGAWMALTKPWWIKSWALKFWLAGAEFAGNPRMFGQYPQSADSATKSALATIMANLSADASGVGSDEFKITMLQPATNVGAVWSDLCGRCDASESKLILGSTLNTEIGSTGGNRAAAESQDVSTTLPRLQRDQRQMWSTIERLLFEPFLRFNPARYGGAMPPIPRGESEIVREKPEVDQIIVDRGALSYDELRGSRGFEPWGAAKGGDARIPAVTSGGPPWANASEMAPAGGPDAGGPFPPAASPEDSPPSPPTPTTTPTTTP